MQTSTHIHTKRILDKLIWLIISVNS